jgi:hypothetical protein
MLFANLSKQSVAREMEIPILENCCGKASKCCLAYQNILKRFPVEVIEG